jgi:hypothetical protein
MISKVSHPSETMSHQGINPGVKLSQDLDVRCMDPFLMRRRQSTIAGRDHFAAGLLLRQGQLPGGEVQLGHLVIKTPQGRMCAQVARDPAEHIFDFTEHTSGLKTSGLQGNHPSDREYGSHQE